MLDRLMIKAFMFLIGSMLFLSMIVAATKILVTVWPYTVGGVVGWLVATRPELRARLAGAARRIVRRRPELAWRASDDGLPRPAVAFDDDLIGEEEF